MHVFAKIKLLIAKVKLLIANSRAILNLGLLGFG